MEIKEFEGKEYVEYNSAKQEKKKLIISVLFLVLIAIAVAGLIIAIVVLVKNKDLIKNDPLKYGMEVHNFISCRCIDNQGSTWFSTEEGFKSEGIASGLLLDNFNFTGGG